MKHTYEQIAKRFTLTPDGDLCRIGSRSKAKLGTTKRDGFVRIIFEGVAYQASHIVVLLLTKKWPEGQVCYIDGDRSNINSFNLDDLPPKTASAYAMSVRVKDSDGVYYPSISEAARKVKRSPKSIRRAIDDKTFSAGKKWQIA